MYIPLTEKVDILFSHVTHFCLRRLRPGMGLAMIKRHLLAEEPSIPDAWFLSMGYKPLNEESLENTILKQARDRFLEDFSDFGSKVKEQVKKSKVVFNGAPINAKAARRQVKAIRDAGCEPVYLGPPMFETRPLDEKLAKDGVYPVYLPFYNPKKYPGLFAYSCWFDGAHLTLIGAELFSRQLARTVSTIMKGGEKD